jgi:hypothetical protein
MDSEISKYFFKIMGEDAEYLGKAVEGEVAFFRQEKIQCF